MMCPHCQSKQTTVKYAEKKVYLHCRMCRRDLILMEGTKREIGQYKAQILAQKRRRRVEDRRTQ